MSDKVYVGQKLADIEIKGEFQPYSKVILTLDSETAYIAGDDTGRTLTATCPWGTQEMANAILSQIHGFVYNPFEGSQAILDPAAELGDGCSVGTVYAPLSKIQTTLDALCAADIAATADEELDHEYPYKSQLQQQIEYQIRQVKASLIIDIDSITQQITGINGELAQIKLDITGITQTVQDQAGNISALQQTASSLQSQITSTNGDVSTLKQTATSLQSQINSANGDISALQQTATSLQSQITDTNGNVTALEQKVDSFTLSVTNGPTSSTLQLKAGSAILSSQNITFSGFVTFDGLSGGTTTIDGSCIKTGTIDADRLNLTGAIAFTDLQSSLGNQIQNTADTVSGWTYSGSTYIDGAKIQTGTVTASVLQGGQIQLLTGNGTAVGFLGLTAAQTAGSAISISSVGGLRFLANSGDVFLQNGTEQYVQLVSQKQTTDIQTVAIGNGNLVTNNPSVYLLGLPAQPWKSAYLAEPASIGSDANTKNSIAYDMDKYDALFDLLKPAVYHYNHGTSGRYHAGFIAQDVESAISAVGLQSEDFAGYTKDKETGKYSLRYEEFIPLCVEQIQKLKKRVADLEGLKWTT